MSVIPVFSHGFEKGFSERLQDKHQWVENSVIFENTRDKQPMVPHLEEYMGSSFTRTVAQLSLIAITGVFLIIASRFMYVQLIQGNNYAALSDRNKERSIPIPAERGLIYDRNGVQLTENIPNFSLALIPQDLPRDGELRDKMVKKLAAITSNDEETIRNILEEYGSYSYESIVIEEDIDYETALRLQIQSSEFPGIYIQRGSKRLYLHTDGTIGKEEEEKQVQLQSISHVLGYQGKLSPEELEVLYDEGYLPSDSIGKTGVEQTYETLLRGVYGKRRIEVDARGREQQTLSEDPPTAGNHIVLSIDHEMQIALERVMQEKLVEYGKTRASAVVSDPQTGEILALVSLPSFDNNDFSGGIDAETYQMYLANENNPLFNRAISGKFPSGSTIKPAISAAALQEGIITANTSIYSTGGIAVGSWFFPDWKDGGHGATDVRKSIAWSVNTFYYYIGGGYEDFEGLGVDKIIFYLQKFGFSQKLGIDIPGEAAGFLPSKSWKKEVKNEPWYVGDTYNLSIGQGDFLATPLQINSMTASIANGGTVYQPHIVQTIVDPVNKIGNAVAPVVLKERFIDPGHIYTIKQGMADCVKTGSCWDLRGLPFSSGGKTGTAQWNANKDHHAWFTSFAPLDNPRIAVTVLVEEGGEGSAAAMPIAAEIYTWWAVNRY
ncbi:penicillin-binding protein 2 [Patescibacteria group bacterium]|nr:penicillin-binding protein 2 [Patescibacteria group bacterium]MBU1721978.1 penicillin-binding protein 2 [Patescibacteria group bacterium]MBU1901273.1 penicillin-binding protein 2 [Patescibacteria group bacterium]